MVGNLHIGSYRVMLKYLPCLKDLDTGGFDDC